MAGITVKHSKVVEILDDPSYPVGSSEWNDNHTVTGLENVDNTSDANKPVSTAQAAALALKAPSTFTQTGTGSVSRTVNSKLSDTVSVKDFGATGAGVADDTAAIQAALSSGALSVYIPPGTFLISDLLTMSDNQRIIGAGLGASVISVPATFNMAAHGVVAVGNNSTILDIGISFAQNMNATTRAQCIQFPPAIYGPNVARWIVDRVRISAAWNGIDMRGNCGGVYLGTIDIGALNAGILIDGPLDFVRGGSWEFWPFGMSGSTPVELNVYFDGATTAVSIGRCDGFNVAAINTFRCGVVFTANNALSAAAVIGSLDLDDVNATISCAAGTVNVGVLTGTGNDAAVASANKIIVSGGNLFIGQVDLRMTGTTKTDVLVSGGTLIMNGGKHENSILVAAPLVSVAGGTCEANNIRYGVNGASPTGNRTAGVLKQASGTLRAKGCFFARNTGATGNAIEIGTDSADNWVTDNMIAGWGKSLGFSTVVGYYDFDDAGFETVTLTPQFATNGDFAPANVVVTGGYKRRGSEIFVDIAVTFDTNAYTTASGTFSFGTNLPAPAVVNAPLTLGAIGIVTASGVIYAQMNTSTATINFPNWTSGAGLSSLGTAAILPSKTGVQFRLTGLYRVR